MNALSGLQTLANSIYCRDYVGLISIAHQAALRLQITSAPVSGRYSRLTPEQLADQTPLTSVHCPYIFRYTPTLSYRHRHLPAASWGYPPLTRSHCRFYTSHFPDLAMHLHARIPRLFDPVSHHRACQNLTTFVPDTHQIAIRNTKACSIFGVNSDWFTIGDRIFLRSSA